MNDTQSWFMAKAGVLNIVHTVHTSLFRNCCAHIHTASLSASRNSLASFTCYICVVLYKLLGTTE